MNPNCECVEPCENPRVCDGTPACCAEYLCPAGYDKNEDGACIKPAENCGMC